VEIDRNDALQMYRWMVITRVFEERVVALHKQRGVPELPHACIGQEAVGVGVCYGLHRDDVVLPSLRTRAAFFIKGSSLRTSMAAMFGKDTPECGGKNTSHHIGDPELGLIAGSGIVGGSISVCVGAALALKRIKPQRVAVSFFGDGATNRADFHESLNLAAVLKLPIVFVCENNQYAYSTALSRAVAIPRLAIRADSYGFPGITVDGNDVLAVHKAAREAVERAATQNTPTLLECVTYRWRGHSERDVSGSYRTVEEIEEWKRKCPIERLKKTLLDRGVLNESSDAGIWNEALEMVEDSVAYMESAPYPLPEHTLHGVYAEAR